MIGKRQQDCINTESPHPDECLILFISDGDAHPPAVQGNSNRRTVSALRPCAKDAYMLFQVTLPAQFFVVLAQRFM